ncbi:MAG: T9SS type A sorting domain-containing protein [Chitinophagaceae bacterium]|nr:T9SS type A sorting domain-containing protein [Chitinophagaceae bacterium]
MKKTWMVIILSVLATSAGKANIITGKPLAACNELLLQSTEILDFFVAVQNDSVTIHWSGFKENSRDFFEVERSGNGRSWEVITVVKDENNENSENSYSYIDTEPIRGQSYYRLKQVCENGTSKYSKTIGVYYSALSSSKLIYPNDSESTFLIKDRTLTSRAMTLFNAMGHKIIFNYNTTDDGIQINLKQMPEGVYTLRINRGIANPSIVRLVKK